MCDQEVQTPFARFLRAMFEGKVTELHITGQGIIETADGRKVAQLVTVTVVAGGRDEEFKLETSFSHISHIVSTLGLHMDRVDMLIPGPPTVGQKISRAKERDVDADGS